MVQLDFDRIREHISHHIVAVTYGDPPVNATIECETCGTVLYSADPTAHRRRTQPVVMWQFLLLNSSTVEQQVLAGLEFEHEITNYATVATAKALGIPLAELTGDEDDAWSQMLEAAHEHASYAVSLEQVTVLQFGDDVPKPHQLTRPAEVYRLWPDGTWNTAMVEIPRVTPEARVAEVAIMRHHAELVLHREAVVTVGFFNLPPLPDVPPLSATMPFAWMYDDIDRAAVLEGVGMQLSDFVGLLGQFTLPLSALQQGVDEEAEAIVGEWAGLSPRDKLEAVGRWLACMAVKMQLDSVPTLHANMRSPEIADLVLIPVEQALRSVARAR